MKTLYYVPMVHTPEELGSLNEAIMKTQEALIGKARTEELLDKVAKFWEEVKKIIEASGFYQPEIASTLNIFADGLPNFEVEKVNKIVKNSIRIPVYQIIERLQKAGAKVWGTEDYKLLLKEYRYWQDISQGKGADPLVAEKILKARDRAISKRIHEIMEEENEGASAILFMGYVHKVKDLLIGFEIVNL